MWSTLKYIATVPVLFGIVSFSMFALVDLAPGDAALDLAGPTATEEQIQTVRERLGLDRPLLVRYGEWLVHAVQGDLGVSLARNQPVGELVMSRLDATLSLTAVALVIVLSVGVFLGVLAAVKKGTIWDRLVQLFCAVGIATPSFFVGLILVVVFALQFKLLPATGYTPLLEDPVRWLRSLVLPAVALSLMSVAELTRHIRSASIEVLDKPFILTARSKGLLPAQVMHRHVARNVGIPVVTVLGLRIAHLIGGTVIIETMFGLPGLGSLTVSAVLARDIPVVLGVVTFIVGAVLLVNILVDLSYRVLDPRTAVKR